MQAQKIAVKIPPEVLAEQWYSFMHGLIGQMQTAYRTAQSKGINQKTMAERIGAKPAFVSRCLSGQQNMTVRTIHNLARAMDCRIDMVFRPIDSVPVSNWTPSLAEVRGTTLTSFSLGHERANVAITPSTSSTILVRARPHVE